MLSGCNALMPSIFLCATNVSCGVVRICIKVCEQWELRTTALVQQKNLPITCKSEWECGSELVAQCVWTKKGIIDNILNCIWMQQVMNTWMTPCGGVLVVVEVAPFDFSCMCVCLPLELQKQFVISIGIAVSIDSEWIFVLGWSMPLNDTRGVWGVVRIKTACFNRVVGSY